MRKPSLQAAYFMLSLCITTGLLSDLAQAQTTKDLVGAWIAVSNVAEQGGVKSEPYGATPQGMLIFEPDGRYGLILSRKDVPKFASNSRTNGTANENKAVVQGTISHFGRYTVSPADFPALQNVLRAGTTLKTALVGWRDAIMRGSLNDVVARGATQEFRDFLKRSGHQRTREQFTAVGKAYLKSASDRAATRLFATAPILGDRS
jgi:hypothetical protein